MATPFAANDSDTTVIWREYPKIPPIDITADLIGTQLAGDTAEHQAAILSVFARDICSRDDDDGAKHSWSWSWNCRQIAELLSDEECHALQATLETLIGHLEAAPMRREVKRKTDAIVSVVVSAVTQ